MNPLYIKCPSCGEPVAAERYNTDELTPCRRCSRSLGVLAFPALYRQSEETAEALKAKLDDAVCFYHADKKAEQVCDGCGRFLCGLCELPMGEETLCTSCLEHRRKNPGRHALKARQMRYDKLAIYLAVLPILMWYFTLFTAPAAIFVVLRYWKKDTEFSPGRRARMILALIISVLQIAGWLIGIVVFIRGVSNG